MTKAQLISDLKGMIGPAGKGSEVDDTGLTYWLNEAYMIVVGKIAEIYPDYFTKNVTTSSVANQGEYTLPSDFEKVIMVSVSYDGSTFVEATALNNINQASSLTNNNSSEFDQSTPFYYIAGNEIGILPAPSSTISNVIKIWYAYVPAEMSLDADVPAIPKRMQYALKYWAYANYLDQDDEHVAAERMRQRFDSHIDQTISQLADGQLSTPKTVTVMGSSDLYVGQYV